MTQVQNKRPQILIVDDHPRNIEVAAALLKDQYDVETALSGNEALWWADEQLFDLVLLDIMMPGMDGYDTCKQLKNKPGYADIPVIFLTAKTDVESLEQAFTAGGADYVTKPFRPRELMARVQTHIELLQRKKALDDLNQHLEEKVAQRTKELYESNENLRIAKQELEELDRSKTDFLRMASHEIRTPLNGIMGGLELMKMSESMPEDIETYLDMLDVSIKRLERFSLQALDITQLQTKGEEIFNYQDFYLDDFEKAFVQTYLQKKQISGRKVEMAFDVHAKVHADPNYLEKIFEIIMDNALEHSPEDKFVHCGIHKTEDGIECTIRDHGKGFPDRMLKGTVSDFVPGIQHEDQHTGLNFHFVRMAVHTMRGNVELSNARDGGAVVRLLFQVVE